MGHDVGDVAAHPDRSTIDSATGLVERRRIQIASDQASYLTLRSAELSGRRQPVEDVASPPRAANDSPRWVSTDMPVELGSLVPGDQLRTRGLYPGVIDVGFRASPDLFLWPGETVPLRVRYRFAEGPWLDNEKSRLDVALNGRFLKSLPPPRRDWWGTIKRELGAADSR